MLSRDAAVKVAGKGEESSYSYPGKSTRIVKLMTWQKSGEAIVFTNEGGPKVKADEGRYVREGL